MVTASHVRREAQLKELGLHFGNVIMPLDGEDFFTQMGNEDDDKLDVWIVKLTNEFVSSLPSSYQFFDLKSMNIDYDDIITNSYLVLGFPSSKFKLHPEKKIIAHKPFALRTHKHKDKDIHDKTRTYGNTSLILYYRKRRITNTETKQNEEGPSPKGLSGCGVC